MSRAELRRALRLLLLCARETRDNVLHGFGTFAAAVAISACCAFFLSLLLSFRGTLADVLHHHASTASLRVYVYGADDHLSSLVERYLRSHPAVRDVEFTGREEIAKRLGSLLAGTPGLLDPPDPSGLFDSFDVRTKAEAGENAAEEIAQHLSGYPDIEVDRPSRELHAFLRRAGRASAAVTWFFFALAVLVFFFASAGVTRLATEYAREEVAVQSLVGASRRLILAPFVAEGILHGLLGAALGYLLYLAAGAAAFDGVNAIVRDVFAYPADVRLVRGMDVVLVALPALVAAAAGAVVPLSRFHPVRGEERP